MCSSDLVRQAVDGESVTPIGRTEAVLCVDGDKDAQEEGCCQQGFSHEPGVFHSFEEP